MNECVAMATLLTEVEKSTKHENILVSDAVKEILTLVVEKCLHKPETLYLDVNVKSSKREPASRTWFYIKICTSCEITTQEFTGDRFPKMNILLGQLQLFESESHLCLQYPRSDGQPGSVQENLLLMDGKLCSLEQQYKPKRTDCYTVYLRVHLELWKMSEECGEIHNFMLLSKVFRPQDDLSFSMKIGEVMSDTDFRVKQCRKVSTKLPELVLDGSFYLRIDKKITGQPNVSTSEIVRKVLRQTDGSVKAVLELTVIGLCFQHTKSVRGTTTDSSSINIAVFGTNFLPYEGDCTHLQDLAGSVDWNQYGLKLVTTTYSDKCHHHRGHFHGVLTHKKSCHMDKVHMEMFLVIHTDNHIEIHNEYAAVKSLIEESREETGKKVEEMIEQILQPVLTKAKTRNLVYRSIRSVCKGVTDIVSMSSSEEFHSKVLEMMKVPDTVELGNKLESHLKALSFKWHAGVWNESFVPYSTPHAVPTDVQETQVVPTAGHTGNVDVLDHRARESRLLEYLHRDNVKSVSCEQGITGLKKVSETSGNLDPSVEGSEGNRWSNSVGRSIVGDHHMLSYSYNRMSPFTELAFRQDKAETDIFVNKTPDIRQCSIGSKKISPFQEFGDIDMTREFFGEESFNMTRTPEIKQLKRGFDEVSPFHEFGRCNTSMLRERSTGDKTPEITQLTESFQKVSPFQDCTEANTDGMKDNLAEDPFIKDKTPDIIQLTNKLQKVSPFQELANIHSPFTDTTHNENAGGIYITPEIVQMAEQIRGFKEISPFQELACVHVDVVKDYFGEDPFRENNECFIDNRRQTAKCTQNELLAEYPGVYNNDPQSDSLFRPDRWVNTNHSDHSEETVKQAYNSHIFDLSEPLLSANEKQMIEKQDDDSDEWFDDVLDGVDHWLQ